MGFGNVRKGETMITKEICCEYCPSRKDLLEVTHHGDISIVCKLCYKKIFLEVKKQ